METSAQNRQRITDVSGANYQFSSLSVGMLLPVYSRLVKTSPETESPSRLILTVRPSMSYSLVHISSLNQERLLLNPQFSVGSYYLWRTKHKMILNGRVMLNEDEFTINNPDPRYTFSALYAHKIHPQFSYYGGLAYSYVFGEGKFLPLLGGYFSWGNRSSVSLIFPVQAAYRMQATPNIRLSFYARPQGGINRYENRLTVTDSTQKILIFRRKCVSLGVTASFRIQPNLTFVMDPSFLVAQKISFTEEDASGGQKLADNSLDKGFQIRLALLWRPWQNSIRNKQRNHNPAEEDADDYQPLF
jgi:hypothetical protein